MTSIATQLDDAIKDAVTGAPGDRLLFLGRHPSHVSASPAKRHNSAGGESDTSDELTLYFTRRLSSPQQQCQDTHLWTRLLMVGNLRIGDVYSIVVA